MKTLDAKLFVATKAQAAAAKAAVKTETHEEFRARMDAEALALALDGKSRKNIMEELGIGERQARKAVDAAKLMKQVNATAGVAKPASIRNREDWLNAVADQMKPWFEKVGSPLPKVRISIGFTSNGKKGKAIGECWTDSASADKTHEIFIRPDRADSLEVAAILCHELVHAAVGIPAGHGKAFRKVATAMGLEGKMKATVPGDIFKKAFAPILAEVGPIPHATLRLDVSTGPKKQAARMIKCECETCGYIVRTSKKNLLIALPICPNPKCADFQTAMFAEGFEPGEGEDGDDEAGDDE